MPRLSANPASNGALTFRGEWGWWYWHWTDINNNLVACHANFQVPEAFCGGTPLWTPPFVQSVVSGKYPVEEELVLFLQKAPEAFIYVYSGFPTCESVRIANLQPIGQ